MKEKIKMVKNQPIELESGDVLIPRKILENKCKWKDYVIIRFNYAGTYFPPEKSVDLYISLKEYELVNF